MNKVLRVFLCLFVVSLFVLNVFYSEGLAKFKFASRFSRNRRSGDNQSNGLIEGMDRFEWYFNKLDSSLKTGDKVSTLYAYEFEHEITVTLTSWNFIGYRVFCRYLNEKDEEIGQATESFAYPEYIVNCRKREGTKKIGLSVEKYGEFQALQITDRMMEEPKYDLSMCIATIYGDEPKWLMFIEMIEHYKLQGVQHFYLHIHHAFDYDLKVINDYVRTGEVEVHYLLERDQRTDNHWHMVNIADCLIWSRGESKWTIFADLDERIIMTNYSGTILDYVREVNDEQIGSLQFRQQWVLKTELMPERFQGKDNVSIFLVPNIKIIQIIDWMPTHRWHNSTGIGPPKHTAKCIVDTSKVFIMFIHYVTEFFPGEDYYEIRVDPEEGLVRHYRDQSLGNWGQKWLRQSLEFGPLRETNYPAEYLGNLTENVIKRAVYVYDNNFD